MKITIVTFMAFDRQNTEVFMDKTYEQIHEALTEKCNTYNVLYIIEATGHFAPLNSLKKLSHAD